MNTITPTHSALSATSVNANSQQDIREIFMGSVLKGIKEAIPEILKEVRFDGNVHRMEGSAPFANVNSPIIPPEGLATFYKRNHVVQPCMVFKFEGQHPQTRTNYMFLINFFGLSSKYPSLLIEPSPFAFPADFDARLDSGDLDVRLEALREIYSGQHPFIRRVGDQDHGKRLYAQFQTKLLEFETFCGKQLSDGERTAMLQACMQKQGFVKPEDSKDNRPI